MGWRNLKVSALSELPLPTVALAVGVGVARFVTQVIYMLRSRTWLTYSYRRYTYAYVCVTDTHIIGSIRLAFGEFLGMSVTAASLAYIWWKCERTEARRGGARRGGTWRCQCGLECPQGVGGFIEVTPSSSSLWLSVPFGLKWVTQRIDKIFKIHF